jgi:hypothetical protein
VPLFPASTGDIVGEAAGKLRPALDAANNWQPWQAPAMMQQLAQHLVSKQQGETLGSSSSFTHPKISCGR